VLQPIEKYIDSRNGERKTTAPAPEA